MFVDWIKNTWRSILAEFFATLFLLLFGCMSLCKQEVEAPLSVAIVFGLVIATNVQIFGHISGAHMNPVISVAAVIFGRMSVLTCIAYVIVQCSGAIAGFGLMGILLPEEMKPTGMCVTLPHKDLNLVCAIALEALFTAALVLLCCSIWDFHNMNRHDSVPIKFGLTVMFLVVIGGHLTGTSLNPARSLGPAVWNNVWDFHWIYWVGPLAGGSIASTFYTFVWKR